MRMALAGGGTGGHLFPGLALARHAATEGMVSSVLFFGAERGIEATLVPEHGFEVFAQPLTPVRGRGPADALVALVRLAGAAWVVRGELKRRRIDVMVGLGGVFVEVYGDVAFAPAPLEPLHARSLIETLIGWPVLQGVRGAVPADVDALVDLIVRLSHLVADHANAIAEIDLNPVIVHPKGEGVSVADALIVCTAPARC